MLLRNKMKTRRKGARADLDGPVEVLARVRSGDAEPRARRGKRAGREADHDERDAPV